jgi:hypothetical protein
MQSNKNKPEVSTPKRKVNDRSSTSSNDTSFESSKPVQKKQTVKNPQEKAPKGNEKKNQHRQVKMIRYNRKSPLSKQQKGGVERIIKTLS